MLSQLMHIQQFITSVFEQTHKQHAVIGISGGIDSAVALTLLAKTLGTEAITPILLPYGEQEIGDAMTICTWNGFTIESILNFNIKSSVDQISNTLTGEIVNEKRMGNIMARVRMTVLFDQAAKFDALVCGTENKSEHYLGYFTLHGDAASDLEPLNALYKTEVREIAKQLNLPKQFLDKQPSAGLWAGQTDEQELGFSYLQADQVLREYVDLHKPVDEISPPGVSQSVVRAVINRVESMKYKRQVPYHDASKVTIA